MSARGSFLGSRFPELAALPDNLRIRSLVDRFELGLQTVLDGIERRFLDQPG